MMFTNNRKFHIRTMLCFNSMALGILKCLSPYDCDFCSNNVPCSYFWSTSPAINNLFSSTLKSSHISSIEVDMNRDQKTDRLELSIVVPLDIGENIYAFSSLFFFDVGLHDKAKYKFDSMVYVTHNSPYSMECVSIDGNLELSQSWALASKGTYRTPYAGEELLRVTKMTTAQDLSFASLLRKNSDRNCMFL